MNTHVQKSESFAQIGTTVAELQHFFLRDCFLLAHPVESSVQLLMHAYTWRYGMPFWKVKAKSEGVERS